MCPVSDLQTASDHRYVPTVQCVFDAWGSCLYLDFIGLLAGTLTRTRSQSEFLCPQASSVGNTQRFLPEPLRPARPVPPRL